MSVWWSVVLAGGGLLGAWLLSERRRAGWLVYVVVNVLWVAYAVASEQWGFLVTSLAFIVLNARGYARWHDRDRVRAAATPGCESCVEPA